METISVYLDNMFVRLPKSAEVMRMKQELLEGMEEKYRELKREGKSENEAIGIVISEFGNIEELTAELGIAANEPERSERTEPVLADEEAFAYLTAKRSAGLWTGVGIMLCTCGVAFLLILDALFGGNSIMTNNGSMELGTAVGLLGMFVLIAPAIGMFIYSSMKLGRFDHLQKGFQLPYTLKLELEYNQARYQPTYRFALISGVCLCVLSPVTIFATSAINDDYATYGVAAFLLLAGVAVFLFVQYGNIQGAYTTLLQEPALAAEKKEENRVMGLIGSIIWPLTTAVFLFTGFVYGRWDINWALFPIVGILHGVLNNVYQVVRRKNIS
jgi:DNA-binding protein H-NS